jgi:uncharacterized protein YjeT (DUF2065 family)
VETLRLCLQHPASSPPADFRHPAAVDSESLWAALALVLVIEGLLPFLSPQSWRRAVAQIALLQDGQIRFFGLLAIVAGVLMLWF